MRNFIRQFRLNENNFIHGKFPGGKSFWFFTSIIFLFLFSFSNAQKNSLSNFSSSLNNSSNLFAGNFNHQKNNFYSHRNYFGEWNISPSKGFATITSVASGDWSNPTTWGGSLPGPTDDVIIDAATTVTVDVGTAECNNMVINGTLDFNGGMLLEVFGDFTNDGTLIAGTGNVSFSGPGSSTISGS